MEFFSRYRNHRHHRYADEEEEDEQRYDHFTDDLRLMLRQRRKVRSHEKRRSDEYFSSSTSESKSDQSDESEFDTVRESSLITMSYHGDDENEILVMNQNEIVFKGCLQRGDQFRFKITRERNAQRLDWKFYINGQCQYRLFNCCEFGLINEQKKRKETFHIENIFGSKPCHRCSKSNKSNSASNRSQSVLTTSRTTTTTEVPSTTPKPSEKTKRDLSLNFKSKRGEKQKKKTEDGATDSVVQTNGNHQKKTSDKDKIKEQTSVEREKTPSEGFRANLSDVNEVHLNQNEDPDPPIHFEPVQSPITEQSPTIPTPKRIYGPPQLSTMLSISDTFDPSYTTTHDHQDQVNQFSSIRLEEEKEHPQESDENEENPSNQSVDFLRSMSTNLSGTDNEQNEGENRMLFHRHANLDPTRSNDATQLILTRLGITRQEQNERRDVSTSVFGPREKGNVEHFVLLYLNESSIDPSDLILLRSLVNFVKIFDDIDDCLASINSIVHEKVIVIASKTFTPLVLQRIDDLQQFLYCYSLSDENPSDTFSSNKFRGFYPNIQRLCEDLSKDIQLIVRDLVSYIHVATNGNDAPEFAFVYSALINEILLDATECDSAMKELINFSRSEYQGNDRELAIIDEFESDYQPSRAIWWFTRPCFISKMLNKALRTPDLDILYRLRLFIQHLHQQIANESLSVSDEQSTIVHLGQTIHQNDLEDLIKSLHSSTYLFFNQFLTGTFSLSKSIDVALDLPRPSEEFLPVILHLDLSTHLKYANTSSLRYLVNGHDEVLLNLGILSKIIKIDRIDESQNKTYASIHLQLVELKTEHHLRDLIASKRKDILVPSPLISLIKLMLMVNQESRAEQLIESLYHDETMASNPEFQGALAASCHLVGAAAHQKGDFKRAVNLFHLSLKTFLRFMPEDSVQLSPTYNNIGSMYFRQEDYEQALLYHEKALQVQIKSSTPNLSSMASYSNNIGVVYLKQGQCQKAIKAFSRALQLLQQLDEDNQSDLASTHDNLGDAYLLLEHYEQALAHYTKALQIQRSVKPENPQALASFNNSIGNVYHRLQRYADALIYFQRAVKYQEEYLPKTHPSFASLYNNIGSMYYRQELYEEALPYYLRSLEIELMALPSNHPTIAVTHFNIATTYTGLGRFDEAIASTERSVEQLLKTLPEDHSEVKENRAYIEVIRKKQALKGILQENTTDC